MGRARPLPEEPEEGRHLGGGQRPPQDRLVQPVHTDEDRAHLRRAASDPRTPPEIAEEARSRSEPVHGEPKRRRVGGRVRLEAHVPLELVEATNLRVGIIDQRPDRAAHVRNLPGPTRKRPGDGLRPNVSGDEARLEAGVEAPVRSEATRVRLPRLVPSVEVDRRMVRVRGVRDVVAEDPRIVNDPPLNPRAALTVRFRPPSRKAAVEPLVELKDPKREEPDFHVRTRDLLRVECLKEGPAVGRTPRPGGHPLQVDVVIVAKGLAHLRAILLPPAIGLGVQIDELLPLIPEESWHLGRKEGRRRLGCDSVAVHPPGARQLGGGGFSREERRTQREEGKSASQGLEHLGTGRRGPVKPRRAPKTTKRPHSGSGRRDPSGTRSAAAPVHAPGQPESDPSTVPRATERDVVSSWLLGRFRLSVRMASAVDTSGEAVPTELRLASE